MLADKLQIQNNDVAIGLTTKLIAIGVDIQPKNLQRCVNATF